MSSWRRITKAGKIQQAVMHVFAESHPSRRNYWIDGTIRHPAAEAYAPGAGTQSGHAAGAAVREKKLRYPEHHGKRCTPCAIEIFGTMAPEMVSFMQDVSVAMGEERRAQGLPGKSMLNRWKTDLSRCLVRQGSSTVPAAYG